MKLVVGLGNPGQEYAHNRHNIGFVCLSHFAREQGIRLDRRSGPARTGTGSVAGEEVVLAKPVTYMNRSGDAVLRLMEKYRLEAGDLVVIHDDMDLPPGRIRLRRGSGAGGHKGVASIISALGTQDFVRLRVGIGRPAAVEPLENDVINFVLSDFTPEEEQTMTEVIPRVSEALLCLLTDGLNVCMNKYNYAKETPRGADNALPS